jgi:hypothetical protein
MMGNRIGTPRAVVFRLFYFLLSMYIVTNIYFSTIFLSYVDLIIFKNAKVFYNRLWQIEI